MDNVKEMKNENIGSIKLADDVVAMIAAIAACEVPGVSSRTGRKVADEVMNAVGMKRLTKDVRVEVFGKKVRIEIAVVLDSGYNIPATSQKVQMRVKNAVTNMTGLEVTDVNVHIAGICMENK